MIIDVTYADIFHDTKTEHVNMRNSYNRFTYLQYLSLGFRCWQQENWVDDFYSFRLKYINYFIHMMYSQRRLSFTIDFYASHFCLPIPPRRNPTHVSSSPITPINLPRADAIAILNKFGFDGDYTIIVTLMLYQGIFSWVSWPLNKIFVSILIGWSSYTAFQQHN